MSEHHVCAECTDFIGCGDWGLCCKSAPYNFLCYDHTQACDRFKMGRHINPIVVYADEDGERHGIRSDGATLAECIEKAKELMREGCERVAVIDGDQDRGCPPLWIGGSR